MVKKTIVIENKQGIHARPSSLIVKTLMKYKNTDVFFQKEGSEKINAKSIMALMSMGATYQTILNIIVEGENENEVISELENLINIKKFNEE